MADLDTVAGAVAEPRLAELAEAVGRGAVPGAIDLLELGRAAQVVRFHEQVRGMADARQLEEVTHEMVDGARGPGGLSERALAVTICRTGDLLRPDRLVEHDAAVRRAHRSMVKTKGPLEMWRYTLLLDAEGAAIVDAAIDALAKPVPDPDSGERDLRTAAARRADALLDLVRRAVEAPRRGPATGQDEPGRDDRAGPAPGAVPRGRDDDG